MSNNKSAIRSILLVTLAVALILGFLREAHRRLNDRIRNPYRLQATGDLLIDYMDNHNRWPTGWEELQRFVLSESHVENEVVWIQELKQTVRIDFSFDPMSLRTATDGIQIEPSLTVVMANDGTRHGATRDPNAAIYDYLVQKQNHAK